MSVPAQRVSDLSEEELLARIVPRLPRGADTLLGPGDDAAVVAAPDGRFVVTTDVLVEGRHFRRAWSTGADVGWRAATQNLADIAAMGARPTSMVVALVLPDGVAVDWVLDLADGLAQACGPHGVGVVGGDLSGGDNVIVSITAHGDLGGLDPVLRSGARDGHVLAHSGVLGHSAAGLALLRGGAAGPRDPAEAAHAVDGAERFVRAFLRPDPPLLDGPTAAAAGASAMMDISDGLLKDADRLARASGVSLDLDGRSLGIDVDTLDAVAQSCGSEAIDWVLTGGEDHGLLATFPPERTLPAGFRRIGTVLMPDGAASVLLDGSPPSVVGSGWDHFGGRGHAGGNE